MKSTFIIIGIFLKMSLTAQNLVPNGGFETGICTGFNSNLNQYCDYWYTSVQIPGTDEDEWPSPDWWHTCALSEGMQPPETLLSFQYPASGEGFAGLITWDPNSTDNREMIGIELDIPLEPNVPYLVRFKYNRASSIVTDVATNNLGVKFTSEQYFESLEQARNDFAHFSIDSVMNDTLNWGVVEFEFIPGSTFSYMHIGNFFSNEETTVEFGSGGSSFAYYFIDAVSVSSTLRSYNEQSSPYQVYPNPTSNYLQISGITNAHTDIVLLTLAGKKVLKTKVNQTERLDISSLPAGTYILRVQNKQRIESHKIVKL